MYLNRPDAPVVDAVIVKQLAVNVTNVAFALFDTNQVLIADCIAMVLLTAVRPEKSSGNFTHTLLPVKAFPLCPG